MDFIEQFRTAMAQHGIHCQADIISDRMLHRFHVHGDSIGSLNGWYVLHDTDVPAGAYGCWKRGISESWCSKNRDEMTLTEYKLHQESIMHIREKAETAKIKAHAAGRQAAQEEWKNSKPADPDHPYLLKKGVPPGNLKVDQRRNLIVPIYSSDKQLTSLQYITPDGKKQFLKDGVIKGGYCPIGKAAGQIDTIFICEGWATGMTVNSATGCLVACAFNCGNLFAVAETLRTKLPQAKIIFIADNDQWPNGDGKINNIGVNKAQEAADRLGAVVLYPNFDGFNTQSKPTDFNDLEQLAGLDEVKKQFSVLITKPSSIAEKTVEPSEDEDKQSQASALVDFVVHSAELFHDKNADVYAQYKSTNETRRLDSRQFRDWLLSNFYQKTGKSARDQSVREAISTLSGLARERGACSEVSIRVAMLDDSYYLDMAESGSSRAIKIIAGNWEIIDNPPVRFLRPETMRPLPEPVAGTDISTLFQLINIPENAKCLVIAWLAECLRPDSPFPVLELFGEQGSAKSTTQAILRQLIDPNASNLRAAPKSIEDVFVSAGVTWMASFENVSHLPPAMQDAFCMLATGAGYAKRKLYSDADESVIEVKRPIVLNGISIAVTTQDLVDRTLSIEMPIIHERQKSIDLNKAFEASQGPLLGALLDITAKALYTLHNMKLPPDKRPRLLEFAYLGMAISEVMYGDSQVFLDQFNAARQESIARTIDASPIGLAVIELCEARQSTLEMPIKDIFQAVEKYRPTNAESWPRSAKGFADQLRRVAPALRQLGIECHSLGKRGSHVHWRIAAKDKH